LESRGFSIFWSFNAVYFFFLGFARKSKLIFLLSLISLTLVFIPRFGFQAGGATSWLEIGSFTFQPSEFAKLALIIYLAALLERKIKEGKIRKFKEGLQPFLIILVPFMALLFFQPDMGTLGIICFITLLMFFTAGGSLLHILFLILLGIFLLGIGSIIFPHQAQRIGQKKPAL